MSTRRVRTAVLGHESATPYSPAGVGYAVLALRLAMGWVFFNTGVSRLLSSGWDTHTFAGTIPPSNPGAEVVAALATRAPWALEVCLTYGFALVGVGLLFGAFFRLNALVGGALMGATWVTSLSVQAGGFVNPYLIYVLVLFGLVAFGAGRVVGLDALFEGHSLVERHPRLRLLLG
ncbi:MAG: DoxX family membrane protein [Halodesulfurarchaeum sp.]